VGDRWKIVLQLNFPPGQYGPRTEGLGHRDVSMIVYRDRRKFDHKSEAEVKDAFQPLSPRGFESVKHDQEGFKVALADGRIDCLPGAIHLWCELTPDVLNVLDWVFTNAYDREPIRVQDSGTSFFPRRRSISILARFNWRALFRSSIR